MYRKASIADIPAMMVVRSSVKENVLSNPKLVSQKDYESYLAEEKITWLCEIKGEVVAFCAIDGPKHHVWALFVRPEFEGRGIGKHLHEVMVEWYFSQYTHDLFLTTAQGTRAAIFYLKQGWKENGFDTNGEIIFSKSKPLYSLNESSKVDF